MGCEGLPQTGLKLMDKTQEEKTKKKGGNLVLGIYHRPADQREPIDEGLLLQTEEASHSQALILQGDFNYPDICWKNSTASCRQWKRLLQHPDDSFLSQITDSSTKRNAVLDLMFTNNKELIADVNTGCSLSCSDNVLVEFAGIWHRKEE